MNEFVGQHFDFTKVHYPTQQIDGIKYHTGTRVYWCSNIKNHLPKSVHIFGRWARVIYNGQPARQKTPTTHDEIKPDQPNPLTDPPSLEIIKETPPSQLPQNNPPENTTKPRPPETISKTTPLQIPSPTVNQ